MIIINGNNITLVYKGETYTKQATPEEIAMASIHAQANDYQEIINLCFPTPKTLLNKPGFWEENGSIYYKNIKVSIPKVLANKFMKSEGEDFDRLVRFWGWLSLNPNPRTRENLYGWIEKNGIQLTNGGLMILYRRVERIKETSLAKFVRESYERLRKQKKSTNVTVYEIDHKNNYSLVCNNNSTYSVCNLKEFYNTIQEQVYTDSHTRKERYKIGKESWMKREEGDESEHQCSRGYHAGSQDYSFSGFGDTPIAIVVNPMDVLNSVENHYKMRFTRFTPIAVLNEDAEWINDPEVHKRIDACYDAAVERLETLLSEAEFEDFKKHEILTNEWNLAVGFETVLKILN